MEMSSHALDQERVWGMPVDVAIFTNLTQDHLDYHGTMERYAAAKARLFAGVGTRAPRVSVINLMDPWSRQMSMAGLGRGGELAMNYQVGPFHGAVLPGYSALNVRLEPGKTRFVLHASHTATNVRGGVAIDSPLTGYVNVYNLLAACCGAVARGLTLEEIAGATPHLAQVPGRFQVVPGSAEAGSTVVVDYAHTDDALRNLIVLAREMVKERGGRVITLFGCGGDRDRTKRPRMGRAAGEGSDLVVLTSDNPRSEDPMAIIAEALVGVRETTAERIVEPDRAAAIETAIRAARAGDIVLLAGKGHEKVQIFSDRTIAFDDVAVAQSVLKELV